MKNATVSFWVIVVLTGLLSSCAPAPIPLPPTDTPFATNSPVPSDTPLPTITPIPPTATQIPPIIGTEVDVNLGSSSPISIDTTLKTFKVGVPYTFVIKNVSAEVHSFYITEPISVTGSLAASRDKALLGVPVTELPRNGGLVVKYYTFSASAVGMQLEFECLVQLHYDNGMRLPITVHK